MNAREIRQAQRRSRVTYSEPLATDRIISTAYNAMWSDTSSTTTSYSIPTESYRFFFEEAPAYMPPSDPIGPTGLTGSPGLSGDTLVMGSGGRITWKSMFLEEQEQLEEVTNDFLDLITLD